MIWRTTASELAVAGTAGRIRRRCACGSSQDRQLRGAGGELAETPDDNSCNDRGPALRNFAQGTADCDSASRRRYPGRDRPVAIRCHEVKSSAGRRETGREYGPAHAAVSDRFRQDAQTAADLAK